MRILVAVAVGGALGSVARYALSGWVHRWAGPDFPWGTLMVNVSGSFLLGVAFRVLEGVAVAASWRAFAAIGVAGAFTTFSTFSYEAVLLLQAGEYVRGGLYLSGSVVLGLVAIVAGFAVAAALLHGVAER